jgi:alkanesulfonate monooxygenase SsuD/methylene tetrahydromethanopterin reductase-like flavin-dependent oxidoreductase (luciferase family)
MLGGTREKAEALRRDFQWLFDFGYSVPPYNVPMGRLLFGTPDEVSRQIEDLLKVMPFEEMFLWHNVGLHDERLALDAVELFASQVMPRFAHATARLPA